MTKTVYVAGPYTRGDVAVNVREAVIMANHLSQFGFVPYVPHLSHFWHMIIPHEYEFWMALDLEWLKRCDILLRLHGESAGADKEVCAAKDMGIPVYSTLSDLLKAEAPQ